MANKFKLNLTADQTTATNLFSLLWWWSRMMKAAGWIYKAGACGSTGSTTISVASNNVAAPGGGTVYAASTTGFPTQGTFTIGTINATVSYTGITSGSFTGCVLQAGSGTMLTGLTVTSVKDTTALAACDPWGGAVDPTTDVYAGANQAMLDGKAAWSVYEGPPTVKLICSSLSVGTFLRTETVTQATSLAEGEVLGYVPAAAGTSSWLVVLPRIGTFDGTHAVTGATSAATITPTSIQTVRRQLMIAKNTTVTAGWIAYIAATDAEITTGAGTVLFSELALSANCSATVAPGMSSSGSNRFPAQGMMCVGTAEGAAATFTGASTNMGKAQIVATNATGSAGVSPDGSSFVALYDTGSAGYRFFGLQRVDDNEIGEMDPFVWLGLTSEAASGLTGRTAGSTVGTVGWGNQYGTTSGSPGKGYCARGTGTFATPPDNFTPYVLTVSSVVGAAPAAFTSNAASAAKIRAHIDNNVLPIEPFGVASVVTNYTQPKGRLRWLGYIPSGSSVDTAGAKTWLALNSAVAGTSPTPVIGPYDGSTTPAMS